MRRINLTAPYNGRPDWWIKLQYFMLWPFVWLLIPFGRVNRK